MPVTIDKILGEPLLHSHTSADISDLATLLDGKVDVSGDTMTGGLTLNGGFSADKGLIFGNGDTGIYESSDDILRFQTFGVDALFISSSQRFGVGAAASTVARLMVTATGGDQTCLQITGDVSRYLLNFTGVITSDGSSPPMAFRAVPTLIPSGDIATGYVLNNNILLSGGSGFTITNMIGQFVRPSLQSDWAGTVTNYIGIQVSASTLTGSPTGTLANYTAYQVGSISSNITGTAKAYESLLNTGTNNWGLYLSGTAQNYIRGNVQIGNGGGTPVDLLDVVSTTGGILTLRRNDTSVTANDMVGKIQFYAADTSTITNFIVADIEAQATNTVTTDINPGRLIFRTAGTGVGATVTERMRVDELGKVGIGATTLTEHLEVGKDGDAFSNYIRVQTDNASTYAAGFKFGFGGVDYGLIDIQFDTRTTDGIKMGGNSSATAYPVSITQGGSTRIFLTTTNRIGLNTTSPATFLDVNGASTFRTGATFVDHNPEITGSIANGWWTTIYQSGTGGGGQNAFRRADGTSASPTNVKSGMSLGSFSFRGYDGTAFTGSKALVTAQASENWTSTANGTNMQFQVTPIGSTAVATAMFIRGDGNVGIGTSNPVGKLHLAGAATASAWGASGIQSHFAAATYTDSSTASSGTAATAVSNSILAPTFAASNTLVTMTNAATLYIGGAPIAGTNVTLTNKYALWIDADNLRLDGSLDLSNAGGGNIITDTTTGTKIGTATSQKLGFWNVTPIVQPTTAGAAATFVANTSGIANDTATFDGYTIGQIVKALRNVGILA